MSSTSTDAWSPTSSLGGNLCDSVGSERIERFDLQEERSRWVFNCDHYFYDDDGNANGEMSMNMIVTTKEVFQLKYKRGKTMFAQAAVFPHQRGVVILAPPCTRSRLQGIRYLSSSVVMMGPINHNDDVINDDANDDADDNDANDYDEHKWK